MMATTHVLAGITLAGVALYASPELAPVAVAAALIGGMFPDLDLYAGHRKTLHYPVYYSALAVPAAMAAIIAPSTFTVAAGYFLLAAALHSVMDSFGGGLELRPWEATSDRGVYDHFNGRWIRPRRWIRYDGAPEDLLLAGVFSLPGLLLFDGPIPALIGVILGISAVYTLLRKQLIRIAEWLIERLPETVLVRVPERFIEDYVD